MWAEPTKNGKVRFVERYEDPLTGKQKKVSVVMDKNTAATRKLATAALNDKITAKVDNSLPYLKKDNLTLSELVKLYREHQQHSVTQSTYRRNYYAIQSITKKLGEGTLVSNLTAGYVKARFSAGKDEAGTINERYVRFKALMRWAYENDYVSDIRWLDKIKPLPNKEKRERLQEKFLEPEDVQALLAGMQVIRWKYLTQLLVLSGMRCGEALALEMRDVNLSDQTITISKTFDSVNQLVTAPKTLCSNRVIDMQKELSDLCREIRKFTQSEKMKRGFRGKLFLCDINGDHLNYFAYNKYLGEVSERTIGRKVTTHIMRHTHISLLAAAGVPLETITRRVGHENSDITRSVYLHVTNRQRNLDRNRLQAVKLL